MATYRTKPVVVDAVRYDGRNFIDIAREFECDVLTEDAEYSEWIVVHVDGRDINARIRDGDWVVRGVDGDLRSCSNETFELTHEPVEGS